MPLATMDAKIAQKLVKLQFTKSNSQAKFIGDWKTTIANLFAKIRSTKLRENQFLGTRSPYPTVIKVMMAKYMQSE